MSAGQEGSAGGRRLGRRQPNGSREIMLGKPRLQTGFESVNMGNQRSLALLKRYAESRQTSFNELARIRRGTEQIPDFLPFGCHFLRLHGVLGKASARLLLVLRGIAPAGFHGLCAVVETEVEGELRESVKVSGGFESLTVMSMLVSEFEQRRAEGLELAA